MISLAVLASGSGTNFEAICKEFHDMEFFPRLLVCDRPKAGVFERAQRWGVEAVHLPFPTAMREEAALNLETLLKGREINFLVLAGFMKVLPASFISKWRGRVVNIHPSLLPRHPGTNAIEKAWLAGDDIFGITVHLVDEGVDTGPVLFQNFFSKQISDTLESITEKVHLLEHQDYPRVIAEYVKKTFGVEK